MKRLFTFILSTLWIIGLAAQEAPAKWLTKAPDVAQGQSWGIPGQKGKFKKNRFLYLKHRLEEFFLYKHGRWSHSKPWSFKKITKPYQPI